MFDHVVRVEEREMIKPYCLALVGLLCGSALAAPAGQVKTSSGPVTIERAGRSIAAPVGTGVEVGDRIRTGAGGAVGITLRDNSLLSLGPRSVLTIDRFAFDPTTQQGEQQATIRQGTLAVVSGKLAKESPASVEYHTPSAILGVRGTEFAVEVDGIDE
jgi:hypothetical protein